MDINKHKSYCCQYHGCKYNDPDCPVSNKVEKQRYLCEKCCDDLDSEGHIRLILQNMRDMRRWLKERLFNKS